MTAKSLFRHLRNFLRRRRLKSFNTPEGHKVERAFTFDGVDYYHFPDQTKAPTGRLMQSLVIYEEFNMRCTRDYLEKHCAAMDQLFSDPNRSQPVQMMMQLHLNLKERLGLALFPEHIYKLASVVYFDLTESAHIYDPEYNLQKIAKWKAAGGALDFFLKGPLTELIPFTKSLGMPVETYSMIANEFDRIHQADLQAVLSKKA